MSEQRSQQRSSVHESSGRVASSTGEQDAAVRSLRVAIVHDWLVGGGAERVVFELHKMFPDAPIYTSRCTRELRKKFDGKVRTGYLQHWPFSSLRKFLPVLRIWWFSRLKLKGYDLVISSSSAEAKGIRVPKGTLHINYCHSPTHYYWRRFEQYIKSPGFGVLDPIARLGLKLLIAPLRKWDYKASKRPDFMIANSSFIKEQIKKYYGRDAVVIHPPVDVERFKLKGPLKDRHGFVTAGRQIPYKRFDLAIRACAKLGKHLTVIGTGPEHQKLRDLAGSHGVTFLTTVTDEQMPLDFQRAEAFIFPTNVEDFGITGVEAIAAGTPVIAYKAGGPLDYVVPGKTGEFFEQLTVGSLVEALRKFDPKKYDPYAISRSTAQFRPEMFRSKLGSFIQEKI